MAPKAMRKPHEKRNASEDRSGIRNPPTQVIGPHCRAPRAAMTLATVSAPGNTITMTGST
jgi:hypothetical protein